MPRFEYKAMTPQKQIVKNSIIEANQNACVKRLKRSGLIPIEIKLVRTVDVTTSKTDIKKRRNMKSEEELKQEEAIKKLMSKKKNQKVGVIKKLNSIEISGTKRVTPRDVRIFTQDFYLLKKANFNNIDALSTVIESTENETLKEILRDVLAGLEAGEFMYTTMEYYESVFPYIYINMIKVGELSGTLEESLEQAVTYLEDKDTLSRRIKKILIPNIGMFVGLILLTIIAVVVGVPMVEDMFADMGNGTANTLPPITLWFADVCDALLAKWYIIVGVILVAFVAFRVWISTILGRYKWDMFKYKMPIFGKLIYSLDFSRLMQGVYLNLKNGMRIQDSLQVSKNVIKNTVMVSTVESAINNIYAGESWITPFENAGMASPMMIEMLKIGMQTDLTEMLGKLIEYIGIDIENTLEKIVKVLPEITYTFVGVVLIFFTLVVLVPVISIYMGGWMFDAYGV